MLFHLPLAFLPLAAWPGDASAALPAADIAIAAAAPTAAAGRSAVLAAADIVLAGQAIDLFEGQMETLPSGDIALAAAVPTVAMGAAAQLAQTVTMPARFGVLGEQPLAAPPIAAAVVYLPRILEFGGGAPISAGGVSVTLAHTRRLLAHFGVLGEQPLGAPPVDAVIIAAPANLNVAGHALDGFGRRRRPAVRAITN
jgi:hypothetical protein